MENKEDKKKYIIYENDLKFREHRNLNLDLIDWSQNDIKHLLNTNYDSFEYRLSEFKKNKEEYLDLELMKLTNIIFLYNDKYLNLKYLFLSNNNLSGIINLSKMKNLEILDCNHNKIENLILPENILELSCKDNILVELPYLPKIKRLNASNNKIKDINNINKYIEILEINDNLIEKCDLTEYNNLTKLILFKNPLRDIKLSKSIMYCDLSETNIESLQNLYNIEHLVLNKCVNLKLLPPSDNLKILELIESPLEKLLFYKKYELIMIQLNLTKNVSIKYKKDNASLKISKNKYLIISKNVNVFEENV